MNESAAADSVDNLHVIIVGELELFELAARYDFLVDFDSKSLAFQIKQLNQLIETGAGFEGAAFAIDNDVHGCRFYRNRSLQACSYTVEYGKKMKTADLVLYLWYAGRVILWREMFQRTYRFIRFMHKIKLILIGLLVLVSTQLSARSDLNPFSKSLDISFGASVLWKYNDDVAVKSALDNKDAGTYYHLQFDGKSINLMLSESSTDNPSSAKHYDQFAVEDVQIDGQRLPLFQWCLSHQDRHARFLQQGLSVQKNICENNGARGTFSMRLNQDTLDALQAGERLTFVIRPFRTTITVNYDLSDFPEMVAILASKNAPAPLPAPKVAKAVVAPAPVVVAPVVRKCVLEPPAGFETIKKLEYNCNSQSGKARANNNMIALVSKERERRKNIELEKERKRLAEVAAAKKAETERLKLEQKKKEEEAAIAASKLKQQEINAEITAKMLGVCGKMWSKGEHRCYCEKYIDQAPREIQASSNCSGGG